MSSPNTQPMAPSSPSIIRRSKRFPFFRLRAPRFLVAELTQVQEFLILLRVRPQITVLNYTETLILLWVSAVFSMACSWLELLLSGTLLPLLPVLGQDGWQLLLSPFTGTNALSPRLRLYAGAFWLLLGLLASFVWIIKQNRQAYQEWRGLRRIHTMSPAERTTVSLQRFLQVSLPSWVSYTLDEPPTPDMLLHLLREREQATAQQTEALAAEQTGEEPGEAAASLSLLLTVTRHLSLSMLGPDGRQMMLVFSHALVPLVGFLAVQEAGRFVVVRVLYTQVYPGGNEDSFAKHRERVNQQILHEAQRAGFFAETDGEEEPQEQGMGERTSPEQDEEPDEQDVAEEAPRAQEDKEEEGPITLFEHEGTGQRSTWRLTPLCQVEVFPFLQSFYAKVVRTLLLQTLKKTMGLMSLVSGQAPHDGTGPLPFSPSNLYAKRGRLMCSVCLFFLFKLQRCSTSHLPRERMFYSPGVDGAVSVPRKSSLPAVAGVGPQDTCEPPESGLILFWEDLPMTGARSIRLCCQQRQYECCPFLRSPGTSHQREASRHGSSWGQSAG